MRYALRGSVVVVVVVCLLLLLFVILLCVCLVCCCVFFFAVNQSIDTQTETQGKRHSNYSDHTHSTNGSG
jgi:hypothetical protein